MSNARVTFEVEGVKHSLYFGMVATEIISQKLFKAATVGDQGSIKHFAYVVYGGLCNVADSKDEQYPSFEEAYLITEAISSDDDLSGQIYAAWADSKPGSELLKRLEGIKKKAEVKPNSKKPTGQK